MTRKNPGHSVGKSVRSARGELGDYATSYIAELRGRAADPMFSGTAEAKVCLRIADELEAKRLAWLAEEVSLQEAELITGYSAAQLRRLQRDGKLTLRRGELPRRPGCGTSARPTVASGGDGGGSLVDDILRRRRIS